MMKTVLAVLLLAAACLAQEKLTLSSADSLQLQAQEPEKVDQFEPVDPEVISSDANKDLEFDMEMMSEKDRPAALPTQEETYKLYNSQIETVRAQAKESGDTYLATARVSLNPSFQFYSEISRSFKAVQKCCPRSVGYRCTQSSYRLPCFYSYFAGKREWCCPLWTVGVTRCNCSQCAVLTSSCANEGRCQRRYSKRSFLAVCFRPFPYIRYIQRYLPTSCYCRI